MNYSDLRKRVPGALSIAECEVLGEQAARTKHAALEVGHYYGLSTCVLLDALPPAVPLVTIDHHRGDQWSFNAPVAEFTECVAPCIGERAFLPILGDMRDALPDLDGPFDFVFYDADHSAEGNADFWTLVQPLLTEQCILTFDDADWESQETLTELATEAGFVSIRTLEFHRGYLDKAHPDTYTLEVMWRHG